MPVLPLFFILSLFASVDKANCFFLNSLVGGKTLIPFQMNKRHKCVWVLLLLVWFGFFLILEGC